MKRFTETSKWDDPWFRRLTPAAKLLWQWMLDHCDAAGVIEPDMDLATFQAGIPMGIDTLSELGDRIAQLNGGKCWIRGFIAFQVGAPSRDCKAHNPIFQSIQKHDLERVFKGYSKGIDTPQEKEKDKDKDGIGGAGGKGNDGEWPERIRAAYARQTHQAAALAAIRTSLDLGRAPELILQGTRECTAIIRAAETAAGTAIKWVPSPATFFTHEQWLDPSAIAASLKPNNHEPDARKRPTMTL